MKDIDCLEKYESYLKNVKNASTNTLSSYLRDIRQLSAYFSSHGDCTFESASKNDLSEYIASLKAAGKSIATVSRAIASIKSFYTFLVDNGIISDNPSGVLVPDKTAQKLPQILTSKEVELLLEQPECVDAKGYRDRAMLELLYATGIRVSELVGLNRADIDFEGRECVVFGKGSKERPVYFDARTKVHLKNYLDSRSDENPALFVTLQNPHKRLEISGVEIRVRELGRKLKVGRVHPHKFRNPNLNKIQTFCQHSTPYKYSASRKF